MRAVAASTCFSEFWISGPVATFSKPAAERCRLALSVESSRRWSLTATFTSASSLRIWPLPASRFPVVFPMLSMFESDMSRCTRPSTASTWIATRLAVSVIASSLWPGSVAPLPTRVFDSPGTMSATMPPRSPLLFRSTWESDGTSYSPSSSSRMATPVESILNRCTRPMFTPSICTGSPRRMPPAFGTCVVTM